MIRTELPYERELFYLIKRKALWRERLMNAQRRFGKPEFNRFLIVRQVAKETLPSVLYKQFMQRYSEAIKAQEKEIEIMSHRNKAALMEFDNAYT